MSLYTADQNQVCFKFESGAYGVASGAGQWIGLVTDHSPSDEENVQMIKYTGTSSRNVGIQINTSKDYEGTVTFHPQNFRMFGFALGSTVDSGSPSPFNHVISELDNDGSYAFTSGTNHNFPSFTIVDVQKGQTDGQHLVRTYKGCIANTLSWTASQGEPVTCELGWIAQSLEIGSQLTDIPTIADEDTSRPYIWSDTQVHLPSGTNITEVTEASWSIDNSAERRHYDNGSKVIENVTPLNRTYEVSLTIDANSTWGKVIQEQYWQGGSEFNMMLENVISAGSEQGFIIMSGCKVTGFESPSPAEGIDEYSVTITPTSTFIETDDLLEKHNPY